MAQLEKILAERSIKLSGSKEQITELQSQLQQLNRKIETSQAQWESKVRRKFFNRPQKCELKFRNSDLDFDLSISFVLI